MVAQVANKYFKDNPQLAQVYELNKRVSSMEEANKAEADSFVIDQIMALQEQGNLMKQNIPMAWRSAQGLSPTVFDMPIMEDEQG